MEISLADMGESFKLFIIRTISGKSEATLGISFNGNLLRASAFTCCLDFRNAIVYS